MAIQVNYRYAFPSVLTRGADADSLFLARYSEVDKRESACFFWGRLSRPYLTARCLMALSAVVRSDFRGLTAARLAQYDPIATAGGDRLRFEGFSRCAGAYARVDIMPDGLDGEFPEPGTTNVDFNPPMISSLATVTPSRSMMMSVGPHDVGVYVDGKANVERKVALPEKWLKGLSTVQIFQSVSEEYCRLTRIQALQLFRSIPRQSVKGDYYLTRRGAGYVFTPVAAAGGMTVGGIHRLRLLEPLLPLADSLKVYAHPAMQSTVWQLSLGPLRFTLALSREAWRGFSGEGAVLDSLLEGISPEMVEAMDRYAYANQRFDPVMFAVGNDFDFLHADNLAARLAAMGLLGYDLDEHCYFYRRLPFRADRILKLNPRMVGAEKIIGEGGVEIVKVDSQTAEARVAGSSGVGHTVVIDRLTGSGRCTCRWHAANGGERGACRHVLAVRKLLNDLDL